MLMIVVSLKVGPRIAIESGACFTRCGGGGKPSWFGTAMRVRIPSLVTFQTMKSVARSSGPS